MSKIITVFGATGVQGGSVVKAILSHPTLSKQFKVRAVTRDPSKANAQALVSRGVEAVKGDMDHLETIKDAIAGSYAVFAVTNYWEKQSKSLEIEQGKTVADTCKSAGVKHLIWSTLPNVTKMTNGKLPHVEHFDSKAEVAEYIESTKGEMIASYFMPGFYMSNLKRMTQVQDGTPTIALPWNADETQVPLLDTAGDSGKFVAGILLADPSTVNGKFVPAVSEWKTPGDMAAVWTQVAGREIKFGAVPDSVFQGFLPEPIAKEMTENMVLVRDYSYYGPGAEKEQSKVNEILGDMQPTTWEQWLQANGPWKWD